MGKIHDTAVFNRENFNSRYRISTVGFLIQQFYKAVHTEFKDENTRLDKFKEYLGKYDLTMPSYRKFIENEMDYYHPETTKMPKTRKLALEYIYENWTKDDRGNTSNKDLNMSVDILIEEDEIIGVDYYQHIYIPHPLDGLFVIDSASPQRKLDILESKIDKVLNPVRTDPVELPNFESYANTVSSTPKGKPAKKVAGKRCAVYVSAQKGTTEEQLMEKCKSSLLDYSLKVEKLPVETVTTNFRVTCESWPVNLELWKNQLWQKIGVKVRPWHGPIQDFLLKTKIRRLISKIDSNTPKYEIKNKVKMLYNSYTNLSIEIQEFQHKNQNENYKNYVVEISSNTQTNIKDELSPYCTQHNIFIRPWKGKLPQYSYPKFV